MSQPGAGLRRVNHRINLQRSRHRNGAAVFNVLGQELGKQRIALRAFGKRFQLFFVTQTHGTVQAHRTKLRAGPSDGTQRRVESARGHRHRAQAIAFAQNNAQKRNAQMGGCNKHAADMAHLCGRLGVRAHHKARRVDQAHQGQAMRVTELHKPAGLVGSIGVNGAAQVLGVVGEDAYRPAFNARQCGVNPHAKTGAQVQDAVGIGQSVHSCQAVVHAQAIFRHHIAQEFCVWGMPLRCAALKKSEVFFGCGHGLGFVFHQDVDDAVGVLHRARANRFWLENPQAPAFDHGRAAHADIARARGDDDIATT